MSVHRRSGQFSLLWEALQKQMADPIPGGTLFGSFDQNHWRVTSHEEPKHYHRKNRCSRHSLTAAARGDLPMGEMAALCSLRSKLSEACE